MRAHKDVCGCVDQNLLNATEGFSYKTSTKCAGEGGAAYDAESSSVIRLSNGMVLYLREVFMVSRTPPRTYGHMHECTHTHAQYTHTHTQHTCARARACTLTHTHLRR